MNDVYQLEIRRIQTIKNDIQFDFFINDLQLSRLLNIDRLTDPQFSGFDLDILEIDKLKFPEYDIFKIVKRAVSIFLCHEKPSNQFATDRVVLYRCHCGSDYCGVISFILNFDSDYFYWSDIRFEDENNTIDTEVKPIKILKFERNNYEIIFNDFLKRYDNGK